MDPYTKSGISSQLAKLHREGEERAAQRLAQEFGLQYVDLYKTPASVEALRLVPETEAKDAKLAVVEIKARKVAVAVQNPKLPATQKALKKLEEDKYSVKVFVSSLSGLQQVWALYKFVKPPAEEITGKVKLDEKKLKELAAKLASFAALQAEIAKLDFAKSSPVSILETVLGGALSIKASDIHFEAEEKAARIRLRVDGVLHDVFGALPHVNYGSVVSRVKLLSGLKINVRDEAQDGRFTIGLEKKEIEVRVSIIPSEYGETIVMRLLDPEATSIGLAKLGLREDDLQIAERNIAKPNGLILNTGPTGSGKTTTLYAFLRHINNPEIKIITLEDPIEYRLEGVEQTQVSEEAGYTFANGLRAIVRQDPDAILVGEVRDKDTADIAFQAALTGHLVLSTLHTNDAVGAVPRLINLGVQPVSMGPAINLVIAQRLVRRLCASCRKPVSLSTERQNKIKKFLENLPKRVNQSGYEKYQVFESGGGCAKCGGFGYKGRIGIFEFFEGGSELEQVILKNPSELALGELAKKQEMVTMQEDGVLKALQGETSLEEVEGATGKIDW